MELVKTTASFYNSRAIEGSAETHICKLIVIHVLLLLLLCTYDMLYQVTLFRIWYIYTNLLVKLGSFCALDNTMQCITKYEVCGILKAVPRRFPQNLELCMEASECDEVLYRYIRVVR